MLVGDHRLEHRLRRGAERKTGTAARAYRVRADEDQPRYAFGRYGGGVKCDVTAERMPDNRGPGHVSLVQRGDQVGSEPCDVIPVQRVIGATVTALGDADDAMPSLGEDPDLTVPKLVIQPEAGDQYDRRPGPKILHVDPHSVIDLDEWHVGVTFRIRVMILVVLIIRINVASARRSPRSRRRASAVSEALRPLGRRAKQDEELLVDLKIVRAERTE